MNEPIDLLFLGREERLIKIAKDWGREGCICHKAGSSGLRFRNFDLPLFAVLP